MWKGLRCDISAAARIHCYMLGLLMQDLETHPPKAEIHFPEEGAWVSGE